MVAFIPLLALFLMLPFVMLINQAATQARMTTKLFEKHTTNRYILEGALEYLLVWLARHKDGVITTESFHLTIPIGGQQYLIDLRQIQQTKRHGGPQELKQTKTQMSTFAGQEDAQKLLEHALINIEAVIRSSKGMKIGTVTATIERGVGHESNKAFLFSYKCVLVPNN